MANDPRPPAVHLTRHVEEEGLVFEEAISSPVCDLCFDQGPVWDYPCRRFVIEELGFGSDEGWAVCATCAELVEEEDVDALVERGLAVFGQRQRAVALQAIVRGFLSHRAGPRQPFG